MKVYFLGGQSWLLESSFEKILVDPILGEKFGTGRSPSFVIHPPRVIAEELYSDVSTLIFSTEHFQHFDLQSVLRWKKALSVNRPDLRPRIVVSRMVSLALQEFLTSLGVDLLVLSPGKNYDIGNFEVVMALSEPEVFIWDARVVGIALAEKSATPLAWAYFQSDTMINSKFAEPAHWAKRPSFVVITNHLRVGLESGYSARDNFLVPNEAGNSAQEVLMAASALVPTSKISLGLSLSYAIVGASYERLGLATPSGRIDNSQMADLLNRLSVGTNFYAPVPGDVFEVSNSQSEVLPRSEHVLLNGKSEDTLRMPFELYPIFQEKEVSGFTSKIDESELLRNLNEILGPKMQITPFGEEMVFADFYLDRPSISKRFALQLEDGENSRQFVFDLSLARFVEEEFNGDRAMLEYPFGVRVGLADFKHMLCGEITLGELVFAGFRQWCLPSSLERTPWAAFLTVYSECFSREIAEARVRVMQREAKLEIKREAELNV